MPGDLVSVAHLQGAALVVAAAAFLPWWPAACRLSELLLPVEQPRPVEVWQGYMADRFLGNPCMAELPVLEGEGGVDRWLRAGDSKRVSQVLDMEVDLLSEVDARDFFYYTVSSPLQVKPR